MLMMNFQKPTKTLSDFKDSDIFSDEVSELDRKTIRDWFDTRVVCDDDNFPRYFRRVMGVQYPRYLQLMRVQPGIAGTEYDWMVQDYKAAKNIVKGNNTGTAEETANATSEGTSKNETKSTTTTDETVKNNSSETGTDTRTDDLSSTSKTIKTGGHTDTDTIDKQSERTPNLTETGTDTLTGGHTVSASGTDTTSHDKNTAQTTTGSVVDNYGANGLVDTKSVKGAYVDISYNNDQQQHEKGTQETVSDHANEKDAQKTMPMSTTNAVSQQGAGSDQVDSITLNFGGSASSLGERDNTEHRSTKNSGADNDTATTKGLTGRRYGVHAGQDGTIVEDGTEDPYIEQNTRKGQVTKTYDAYKVANSGSDKDATIYGKSEDTEYNNEKHTTSKATTGNEITADTGTETHETVYKNETDSVNGTNTGTVKNDTQKDIEGSTKTDGTVTGTTGQTGNTTSSTDTTKKTTSTAENSTDARSESNGRHEDPAAIMTRAVSFIEGTSAWLWFSEQLESCFYAIYDI